MTLPPYGVTIFCDDIRHEAGNKITYVGCYRNVLYVQNEFPFLLPKFGMAVDYREPMEIPPAPVALKIYLPGDEDVPTLAGDLVSEQMIAEMSDQPVPEIAGDSLPTRIHHTTMMLSPFVIQQPGWIRVRAEREGWDTVRLGALNVQQSPDNQAAETTKTLKSKKKKK